MAIFSYTARSREGMLIRSEMEAPSEEVVASQIRQAGATPIQIQQALDETDPLERTLHKLRRRRVSLEDLIFLCRQMYRLTRAGVPIIQAITGVAEMTRSPAISDALHDVTESLKGGRDLAGSMQLHPRVFSGIFVSVIQVGESTGRLDEAFKNLASYLELDRETRRRIQSATRYPIFVGVGIVLALAIINLMVIPSFARMFESFDAELPWATQVLMTTSNFFVWYWPHMLIGTIGGVVGLNAWIRTEEGRYIWDRFKLRIPAVGSVLRRAMLARYARSFAMTYGAGIPIIQALHTAARATDNRYIESLLADMRHSIERGESLTRAASGCGAFDPLILQIMAVGETSGALAEMHQEIAETYESEVDYDLKQLTDLIEPLLIVGAGAVVFVLALGVYLPMWDLATAMRGGGG